MTAPATVSTTRPGTALRWRAKPIETRAEVSKAGVLRADAIRATADVDGRANKVVPVANEAAPSQDTAPQLAPALSLPAAEPEGSLIGEPAARMAQFPRRTPDYAVPPPFSPAPETIETDDRGTQTLQIDCDQERAKLKPIRVVSNSLKPEAGDLPPECGPRDEQFIARNWSCMTYTWKAANMCHKPLYFEQPRVERYGHAFPRPIQPFVSAATFFVSVPLLPYKMGLEPPNECVYVLGYYRPGSCAPYQLPGFPLSLKGALFEGAAVGVGCAMVPGIFIPGP